MQFLFLLEQVVNGLVLGGYYLLIALGLSLIFSVGGVVNLAHGAFYAFGAYASLEIAKHLGFGPALVLSPLAVALLGILFERYLLRRFYTADPILSLLVTFGLAMVAEQLIRMIWGAAPLPASMPAGFKGQLIVGDFMFSPQHSRCIMLLKNHGVLMQQIFHDVRPARKGIYNHGTFSPPIFEQRLRDDFKDSSGGGGAQPEIPVLHAQFHVFIVAA